MEAAMEVLEVEVITPEQLEAEAKARLEKIQGDMVKKRDEWVAARNRDGIETEWNKARKLYEGQDVTGDDGDMVSVLKSGAQVRRKNAPKRSRVVINVIRPKTRMIVARFAQIVLPVDDRNWAMKPTPVPEVSEMTKSDKVVTAPGMPPVTEKLIGQSIQHHATEACKRMQDEIDDVLNECNFNGEERLMITSAVQYGTGIIKGPFPKLSTHTKWSRQGGAFTKSVVDKEVPASECIKVWNFFPDPACGDSIQNGSGAIERKDITAKALRKMARTPSGFDKEAIAQVLKEKPKRVTCLDGRPGRVDADVEGLYELWEYHGEIEPEDTIAMSPRVGYEENPLECEHAVVLMCNDRIIGLIPSYCEDGVLPYDSFPWEPREDSIWGRGAPIAMETQQRVINSAWRTTMDNSGLLGPNLVVKNTAIEPQDGSWEISGRKIWIAQEDVDDVSKAFMEVNFNTRLEETFALIDKAMALLEQETNFPLLLQGERGASPETLGGQVMLEANADADTRQRVKAFDDKVTKPHLSRYYDWMMTRSEKNEIKGDYEVDARGSSALIEKDVRNQAAIGLAAVTSNPQFAPLVKPLQALKAILRAMRQDPEEIVKNDDELAAEAEAAKQNPPPQDPRIESARIAAESKAKSDQNMREIKAAELAHDAQKEQGEFEIAQTTNAVKRDVELSKILATQQNEQAARDSAERLQNLEIANERDLFNAEASLRVNTGEGI